jgi:elongation factor Ts
VSESADGMSVSAEQVKRLREVTGAGWMDCKRALQESDGDFDRAVELLRQRGLAAAAKRAHRTATEGRVEAYVHGDGRIGVLVEVNCESDFVANTEDFKSLARDLAIHIAGHPDTQWVSRDDVPPEDVEQERKIYEAIAREEGKPENVISRIVEGKLEAFYKQRCLLEQPFFRDMEGKTTVGDLVAGVASTVGENVRVRRFARFVRGESGG